MQKFLYIIATLIVGLLCSATSQSIAQPPSKTAPVSERLLGASRDLNPAVTLSDRPVSDKQVLIYYTNEPNLSAYQKLRSMMAVQAEPKFKEVVKRIDSELKKFPGALSSELSAIQSKTPSNVGAIIFTNKLARNGECLVHTIGSNEFKPIRFEFEQPQPIDQTLHPLTSPHVFASAIETVVDLFPPNQHSFVLVTKAHGTEKLAMATILGQVLDVTSPTELVAKLAQLEQKKDAHVLKLADGTLSPNTHDSLNPDPLVNKTLSPTAHDSLSPNAQDTLTPNAQDTLSPNAQDTLSPNAQDTLSPNAQDTLSPNSENMLGGKILVTGMSKTDLYEALQARADKSGFFVSLYFADACHSESLPPLNFAEESKTNAAEPALGTVFASDTTGLRYTTLNYNDVLDSVQKGESLVNSMHRHLTEAQQSQQHIPAKSK